jgi:hypothetical protein
MNFNKNLLFRLAQYRATNQKKYALKKNTLQRSPIFFPEKDIFI